MIGLATLPLVLLAAATPPPPGAEWRALQPGFELGRFLSPRPSQMGDSTISVVRVDPALFELRLLSAKLLEVDALPAPEWAARHGALAVINASMFREDGLTSVGHMRAGEAFNNRAWNRDNAVFVAQPRVAGLPAAQILDRACEDAGTRAKSYGVAVQNIRMLDCSRRNVWAQQPRRWSTAAVGQDGSGRILLIHARSPWSTHDLIDILLLLPLDLRRLMYVEGGPEASLYAKVAGRVELEAMGSFETGFFEHDGNRSFWPLPNVLAVLPR
jgi:hypothetical protein